MTRQGPTVVQARTLAALTTIAAVLVGCATTPDDVSTLPSTEKPVPRTVLSAPTRGVVPAQAVISAPGTSGTLTVTVRSVEVSPGATVVAWAMRWDDPDKPADARSPVGYSYDGDAKTPILVDRTAMQVHYPLCPDGGWNGDNPDSCGVSGLYSPRGRDSTKLTNHQTLEAWAVFSEVSPDTQTVDLTMPAGLLTTDGLLAFPALPVTRGSPAEQPEPEQPGEPDNPEAHARPSTPAPTPTSPATPVEVVVDAPGASGTLTVTVSSVTAFDTATVVTWTLRWDDPDKPDSNYQEMASVVHNSATFAPTLSDRAAMRVYFPMCTINSWSPAEKTGHASLTSCAYAGLFAPNDLDRSNGLRLVNHQTVYGWAVFPPVSQEVSTVDLALPHSLPAFFALPVTHATGAPTARGSLASALADLQVTNEMQSQATFALAAETTVFPWARTEGSTVSLATDLLFETGRADLTETAQAALSSLAAQIPEGAAVAIDGHTDSIMSDEVNIPLSRAQAQAVAEALAVARPDLGLTVTGHGAGSPTAASSNRDGTDRPIGRQLNRRVTLTY